MINIEYDVFDAVYPFVASLVPDGCFKSIFVPNPPKFPFATLMEMDNVTERDHRSTAINEDYAILTYEANVYATNKDTCRTVMDAIDTAMIQIGFTRSSMQFVPNLADITIFRITARYRAAADENKVIYRHD